MEIISKPSLSQSCLAWMSSASSEVHDVFSADYAEFGAGHADGLHGFEGDTKVGRKFVGDGGNSKFRGHLCGFDISGFFKMTGLNFLLANHIFLNFSSNRHGESIDETDLVRDLEVRDLAFAKVTDFFF